jgi:hypothetical protein
MKKVIVLPGVVRLRRESELRVLSERPFVIVTV